MHHLGRSSLFQYKMEPLKHQAALFERARAKEYFGVFWDMGLGKTKHALDVGAWLYCMDKIDRILVIAKNGVHRNWVETEIPQHWSPSNPCDAAYWSSSRGGLVPWTKRKPSLNACQIACFNSEAMATKKGQIAAWEFAKGGRTFLVVDESHEFKGETSLRTKALLKIAPLCPYRRIMSGTPGGDGSPLDMYCQLAILSTDILHGMSYWGFRSRYCVLKPIPGKVSRAGRPIETVVAYKNLDEFKTLIKPHYERLEKEQCLDLPPKTYKRELFDLSENERSAYKEMSEKLVVMLNATTGKILTDFESLLDSSIIEMLQEEPLTSVQAKLPITQMMRLHQITCGHAPREARVSDDPRDDNSFHLFGRSRLDHLLKVVEDIRPDEKVIIWAVYRRSMVEIVDALTERYGADAVAGYSALTKSDRREEIKQDFQDMKHPLRFFVGQPKAGGTGLTLTAASKVIYHSNSYPLITRLQSEDRAHRIGQTKNVLYIDLEAADTVDSKIIEALRNKRDLAAELTGDTLKEWLT